jgi:hypothetical protein
MQPSSAIQRPDLGLALEEFDLEASRAGFIGAKVAPVIDVALATANFSRVKIEQLLEPSPNTARAPGAGYSRGQSTFTQDNYVTTENGWEEPVDDEEQAIYAYTIDAELISAKRARDIIARNYEVRVKTLVINTTTWTGSSLTTGVSTPWTTHATATPIDDVLGASKKVYLNFGIVPNSVILTWQDFRDVRECAQIVDRIKYSGRDDPKNITTQMLAEVWDVSQVLVGNAVYNSANSGQSASLAAIWPKGSVMVAKVATSDDLREPALARTFNFTGTGGTPEGVVEEYREEKRRSSIIRVRHRTGEKVINKECGHLLTGVSS